MFASKITMASVTVHAHIASYAVVSTGLQQKGERTMRGRRNSIFLLLVPFPISKKDKKEKSERTLQRRFPLFFQRNIRLRSTIAASMTTSKFAGKICGVMDALKLDEIASYFAKDDEIGPYVVCGGVSINAFNEYVGDGEELRIALRFLDLNHGGISIVDLPTVVHGSTVMLLDGGPAMLASTMCCC